MKDDILIGDTPKARARRGRLVGLTPAGRLWKHARLADVEGVVERADFERFLIVTLVRNPWDRMVSYYHWLRDQRFDHPAVRLAQVCGFSAFLNAPATQAAFLASPVDHYLTDGSGRVHDALYIRLEHLEADLVPFAAHLGFRPQVPRVNQSMRPTDWRSLYSDADAGVVARICAKDIARFGYQFDP